MMLKQEQEAGEVKRVEGSSQRREGEVQESAWEFLALEPFCSMKLQGWSMPSKSTEKRRCRSSCCATDLRSATTSVRRCLQGHCCPSLTVRISFSGRKQPQAEDRCSFVHANPGPSLSRTTSLNIRCKREALRISQRMNGNALLRIIITPSYRKRLACQNPFHRFQKVTHVFIWSTLNF
eukprot:RCo017380